MNWLGGFINRGLERFSHGVEPNKACLCFGVQERDTELVQKHKK